MSEYIVIQEALVILLFFLGIILGMGFLTVLDRLYKQNHPDPRSYGVSLEKVTEKYLVEAGGGLIYTKNGTRYFVNSGLMSHFEIGDLVIIAYVTKPVSEEKQNLHDPYIEYHTVQAIESIGPEDMMNGKEPDNRDVH